MSNKSVFQNMFTDSDETGSQEEQKGVDTTPEEIVVVNQLTPEAFQELFKRPRAGSLIYKLKKGEAKGKSASKLVEDIIVECVLVSKTDVPFKSYMIGRMVMGHTSAMDFANNCAQTMRNHSLSEEQLLPHLFGPKVKSYSDMGDFLKSLLPYHKDILMNHVGLFGRLSGIS